MARTATFYYEGRLAENDEVIDDGGSEAYTVALGRGKLMPPLEEALQEMEPGEEREVRIEARDAYGERTEKAVQKVLVQDIPNGENLPVGEYIAWKNPVSEKPIPVKVTEVRNGIATFDMNHPLAGKDLVYRVKLVKCA